MNKDDALTMLDAWGDFMRGQEDIGYSKINILGRVGDEGLGASHENVRAIIETPRNIQHVEKVVLSMAPKIRKVITHKYIYRLTQEESAGYIKCSRNTLIQRLESGVNYLAGTLFNYR